MSDYKLGLTGPTSRKNRVGNFRKVLSELGRVDSYLEVGVCEGWSGEWWLSNALQSRDSVYVGIDVWLDWDKHGVSGQDVYESAVARLKRFGSRVTLITGWSSEELPLLRPQSFDVIYIDGDHRLIPVLVDTVLAWGLLRVGGVMVWDDYGQRSRGRQPKSAVQGFLHSIPKRHKVLFENWQMGVIKTSHDTEKWG